MKRKTEFNPDPIFWDWILIRAFRKPKVPGFLSAIAYSCHLWLLQHSRELILLLNRLTFLLSLRSKLPHGKRAEGHWTRGAHTRKRKMMLKCGILRITKRRPLPRYAKSQNSWWRHPNQGFDLLDTSLLAEHRVQKGDTQSLLHIGASCVTSKHNRVALLVS